MTRYHVLGGVIVLVAMSALLSVLFLTACGLRLPFGLGEVRFCPAEAAMARPLPDRAFLIAQISEAEARLAAIDCPEPVPEPVAAPAPEPEPLPPPLPDTPLDPAMLNRGDLAALQGCWSLGSEYSVQDGEAGLRIDFADWEVCFGADGNGRETMAGSDGTTCAGPIQVRFDADGTLVIDEPADLPCSNGFAIFRREVRCAVDATGTASCRSLQPEVSGDSPVIMRRAKEQP